MTQDLPPFDPEMPHDEPAPLHAPAAIDTLKQAMRRARQDNAERAGVLSDMRTARLGRLELLQEALQPLVAQVPPDVDTFDIAVMPGATPRLFIDMIAFVEMGRDARLYRLLQDTRHGRTQIAESGDIDTMVDAVTGYVARRLLERDKALAAAPPGSDEAAFERPPDVKGRAEPREGRHSIMASDRMADDRTANHRTTTTALPPASIDRARPRKRRAFRWFGVAFAFLIDLLGSITFFTIVAAICWFVWNRMHTPI